MIRDHRNHRRLRRKVDISFIDYNDPRKTAQNVTQFLRIMDISGGIVGVAEPKNMVVFPDILQKLIRIYFKIFREHGRMNRYIIDVSRYTVHPIGGLRNMDGIPSRRTKYPGQNINRFITAISDKNRLRSNPLEPADLIFQFLLERIGIPVVTMVLVGIFVGIQLYFCFSGKFMTSRRVWFQFADVLANQLQIFFHFIYLRAIHIKSELIVWSSSDKVFKRILTASRCASSCSASAKVLIA